MKKSITLIGMPGAGKSFVGERLSRASKLPLLDLDALLIQKFGSTLQVFIDTYGDEAFLREEEAVTLDALAEVRPSIISPGGSMVYCTHAMDRLARVSRIIYLACPIETIIKRIGEKPRGIVGGRHRPFEDIFAERTKLYELWADETVNGDRDADEIVREILVKV